MKKTIIFLFSILTSIRAFSLVVYDPTNYQANMQQYQVNVLQKIEQVKTATDTARQATYDIQNLKDNATNLESWAGVFLGEESEALLKAIDDLNTINQNSQAVLRNSKEIEKQFDEFYLPTDRLKNLNSRELAEELYKVSKNKTNVLKDNLKTATAIIEQNEKDKSSTRRFMNSTDGAKGQLQSSMATKKGIDQLNTKLTKSLDLQAKQLMAMAQAEADRMAQEKLEKEESERMLEVNKETEIRVEKMRKTGKLW